MEIYSRLFESIEANVEFLSVEWTPKSVCQYTAGLEARTFGARPQKEFEGDLPPGASPQTPPPPPTPEPPVGGHPDDDLDHFPTDYSSTYLGDKLLTMIIPPIAILTALLFAVTIGCCFHRANLRRKAMGNMTEITEENPNLYRQRIPIQFEFERGGGPGGIHRGMGLGEQEAMLDGSKMGRHPVRRTFWLVVLLNFFHLDSNNANETRHWRRWATSFARRTRRWSRHGTWTAHAIPNVTATAASSVKKSLSSSMFSSSHKSLLQHVSHQLESSQESHTSLSLIDRSTLTGYFLSFFL